MKSYGWKINSLIVTLALAFLGYAMIPYLTYNVADVTVTGTVVKHSSNGSKYLVFTDHGVLENTDTWYYMKFNSSDLQGTLMQNGNYKIHSYGFRFPFFSKYPNIVSLTKNN